MGGAGRCTKGGSIRTGSSIGTESTGTVKATVKAGGAKTGTAAAAALPDGRSTLGLFEGKESQGRSDEKIAFMGVIVPQQEEVRGGMFF